MTTHAKTIRLARLIGLDYHASESKQKVWRQAVILGRKWPEWRPYECEADLEPIKAWLKIHHPKWPRTTGCDGEREHCEAFCDAVLAAFDKQHEPNAPAEHNDAMRDSIGTHSDAIELMARNYRDLISERNRYEKYFREEQAKANRLRMSNAALRGVITRLKRAAERVE